MEQKNQISDRKIQIYIGQKEFCKFTTLTIKVLLIKILLFSFFSDRWSFHLFQSNQRLQAIEFVDWPLLEKLLI